MRSKQSYIENGDSGFEGGLRAWGESGGGSSSRKRGGERREKILL